MFDITAMHENELPALEERLQQLLAGDKPLLRLQQAVRLPNLFDISVSPKIAASLGNFVIAATKKEGSTELNLGGLGLKTLPQKLKQTQPWTSLSVNGPMVDLPDWLGELESLEEFKAMNVKLHLLPEAFGQLKRLKKIWIAWADLGLIPTPLRHTKQLEQIILNHCGIRTLPNWLEELPSLYELNLNENQVAHLGHGIRALSSLSILSLRNNRLQSLPDDITQLKKLERLDLRGNPLHYVPDGLKAMQLDAVQWRRFEDKQSRFYKMKHLSLEGAALRKIPDVLKFARDLKRLDVSKNHISNLPAWIDELQNLIELDLRQNPLKELPNSVVSTHLDSEQWRSLHHLICEKNTALERLHIDCGMTDVNISGVARLPKLIELHLHLSQPQAIIGAGSDLYRVTHLHAKRIQALPLGLRNMMQLKHLDLSDSPLEELPEWLGELPFIETLNISNTSIKDLPMALKYSPYLREIGVKRHQRELMENIESVRHDIEFILS